MWRRDRRRASTSSDRRPLLAIGHVSLSADDIGALAAFYQRVGMRKVVRLPGVAILELRGGTHLAISRGAAGAGSLDLMVDDLDAARDTFVAAGSAPGEIRRAAPHRVFDATDPEGNAIIVHSSHVAGIV